MKCKSTQGRTLIVYLKRKPHTYMEMLRYGLSTSPWRRVLECLQPGERLVKDLRGDLVTWRVTSTPK